MSKLALFVAAAVVLWTAGIVAASAIAKDPPGKDPCSHGSTGKQCKPDPQPGHGKDCDHHGKSGGQNEDHCKGDETTETTTTTGTTSTQTTETTTTQEAPPSTTVTTPTGSQTPPSTTPTTTSGETQPPTTGLPRPPKHQKPPAGAPQKPLIQTTKTGKRRLVCPAGTRLFHHRCHAVIEGSG